MIILFSDRLTEQFAQLGNVADLVQLDTGKASNSQLFFDSVQEEFAVQDEPYDKRILLMMSLSVTSTTLTLEKELFMIGKSLGQYGSA